VASDSLRHKVGRLRALEVAIILAPQHSTPAEIKITEQQAMKWRHFDASVKNQNLIVTRILLN
jgi:hypothetical protein